LWLLCNLMLCLGCRHVSLLDNNPTSGRQPVWILQCLCSYWCYHLKHLICVSLQFWRIVLLWANLSDYTSEDQSVNGALYQTIMQVSAATRFCLVSLIIQLKSNGDATQLREALQAAFLFTTTAYWIGMWEISAVIPRLTLQSAALAAIILMWKWGLAKDITA